MTGAPGQPRSRMALRIAAALIAALATGRAHAQCGYSCPAGAAAEPESCGQHANDGCNLGAPAFTQISCGITVCGTAQAQSGDRDTDWYAFSVSDGDGDGVAHISATVTAEFPAVFFILNDDCANILAFAQGESDQCQPATITACVVPGTYRVFVAPGTADGAVYDGIPCGSGDRYWLEVTCGDTCLPEANDECIDAAPITDGASFVDTNEATTDGPAHAACDIGSGDEQIHNDVWYRYTASCTGDVIVETCNLTNFDTRIAIYDGCECPATEARLLKCNDEMFGCDGGSSALFAPVVAGQCYLIRVGGFNGAYGLGTIRITCFDGGLCPDTGECSVANGSPGCSDAGCCETVCAADPFCCLVDWDGFCADAAAELCIAAPAEACCIAEGACVDFAPADCLGIGGSPQGPGTACGSSLTCLPEACCLTDDSCVFITRDECTMMDGTPHGAGSDCGTTTCGGLACDADIAPGGGDDTVNVTDLLALLAAWGPCPAPCPLDIVQDGAINVTDLLTILSQWGPCP